MKIHEIISLCNQYGENTTLKDILLSVQGNNKYLCPKCNGTGSVTIEYNGYPSGLPDSGFVYEATYRKEECDLCKGQGYTSKQMKPHMVQDGWE
jgi:DnaJ-class molecular chaperone